MEQYYLQHGYFSTPGIFETKLSALPGDLTRWLEIAQGWVRHLHDIPMSELVKMNGQAREVELRYVSKMLERIQPDKFGNAKHKIIGICRDIAILMCAILRSKNIPARLRYGFSTYHKKDFNHDIIIVEAWNARDEKWHKIDVRTTPELIVKWDLNITFDLYNLTDDQFIPAHLAWQYVRSNKIAGEQFGAAQYRGAWYVRNTMFLDFLSLMKVEFLVWDAWSVMLEKFQLGDPMQIDSIKKLDYLSEMLSLTAMDNDFKRLFRIYNEEAVFQVPNEVTSYGPIHPQGKTFNVPNSVLPLVQ